MTTNTDKKLNSEGGQKLIWKVIKFWDSPNKFIFWIKFVIGAILFFFLFKFVFKSASQSIFFVLSMAAHEFGHGIVLTMSNIIYKVLMLFPLGAVAAPVNQEENKKSDELPAYTLAWLMQSGIMVNVIFMGIGTLMNVVGSSMGDITFAKLGTDLVYVNVMLGAFNILPVWTLDSGQLFHIIFSSLPEEEDKKLVWQLVGVNLLILALIVASPSWRHSLLNIFSNGSWFAFLVISTIGIIRKAAKDDVSYPSTGKAMNVKQIKFHLMLYSLMVLALFGLPTFSF